ncbi:spindle and kinetochore-associated protein 1-like [Anneissia japonica]|uniref:spindle and kinetochore-associated protein 1-like n=1 Tax=Anneissia japonica TaxID=1529436 RepID=UPI001425681F|nr:spindle and kinetochore-associated protein 1-like [Anneissia japonica]
MESRTVEELQEHFLNKLDNLNKCMQMSNICKEAEVQDVLFSINHELLVLESTVAQMKKRLIKQREEVSQSKLLSEQLKSQNALLQHMSENIPSRLPGLQKVQIEKKQSIVLQAKYEENTEHKDEATKSTTKAPRKVAVPVMDYLTVEEYDSVPKYMKGRLPYETVNNVVEGINKAILAKYTFLKQPVSSLNNKDTKKHKKYKAQETKDTKGVFFCIDEDLKNYSNWRMDSSTRSSLTILRHCGRMRETRGNGIVRYCLV